MALLTFFSCRKEVSLETSAHPPVPGDFRAVIDGVQWAAADSSEGASILGGLINISGISIDNKQLSITLNDTVTGSYTLDQASFSLASYADNGSSGNYAFTTNQGRDTSHAGGVVTVTQIDKVNKTISGTFSLKVYREIDRRQKQISQGVFNQVPYATSLPPARSTDTMRASIDGSTWIAKSIMASALSGQLTISGSGLDGSLSVNLLMPQNISPGSYTLNISGLRYVGLYEPTPTIVLASSGGTLVILENDPVTRRVRGNFRFQATESLGAPTNRTNQITNGYFSVKYN